MSRKRAHVETEDTHEGTFSHADNEEDHLSQLTHDCMLDALSRLDHNDLDQVSLLSHAFENLCEKSRLRVRKFEAIELEMYKSYDREQCLHLGRDPPHESACLIRKKSKPQRIFRYRGYKPERHLPRHAWSKRDKFELVRKNAAFLFERYTFGKVTFSSVKISNTFIDTFENKLKNVPEINFHNCAITKKSTQEVADRFFNLLIVAAPSKLYLGVERANFTEDFIWRFSRLSTSQSLDEWNSKSEYFAPSADFVSTLASYDHIKVVKLRIDESWLIPAVIERLKREKPGSIICKTTKLLNAGEIKRQLTRDIEYKAEGSKHSLRLRHTPHAALIQISECFSESDRTNDTFSLVVKFTEVAEQRQ